MFVVACLFCFALFLLLLFVAYSHLVLLLNWLAVKTFNFLLLKILLLLYYYNNFSLYLKEKKIKKKEFKIQTYVHMYAVNIYLLQKVSQKYNYCGFILYNNFHFPFHFILQNQFFFIRI